MLSGRILLAGKNWSEEMKSKELSFFPFVSTLHRSRLNILLLMYHFPFKSSTPSTFKVKLPAGGGAMLTAEFYDPNLFAREDIERLAVQFQTLLVSAINNPETAIAQLEILSPVERQQQSTTPKHQCTSVVRASSSLF